MNIDRIIELSAINPWPVLARHTKMTEECGEFAEALLHSVGLLPHKTMKEPIEGEAADIIICLIDTLRHVYKHNTDAEFKQMLQTQLELKASKWERLLTGENDG